MLPNTVRGLLPLSQIHSQCSVMTSTFGLFFHLDEKTKEMMKIQKEDYKEHLLPKPSSPPKVDDDDDDDDDDDYSDSDYEDDDYDYEDEDDEEEDDESDVENDKDDDDDDDEVDEWLKSNTKKVTLDSKKIYDYSKDLKKGEPF